MYLVRDAHWLYTNKTKNYRSTLGVWRHICKLGWGVCVCGVCIHDIGGVCVHLCTCGRGEGTGGQMLTSGVFLSLCSQGLSPSLEFTDLTRLYCQSLLWLLAPRLTDSKLQGSTFSHLILSLALGYKWVPLLALLWVLTIKTSNQFLCLHGLPLFRKEVGV